MNVIFINLMWLDTLKNTTMVDEKAFSNSQGIQFSYLIFSNEEMKEAVQDEKRGKLFRRAGAKMELFCYCGNIMLSKALCVFFSGLFSFLPRMLKCLFARNLMCFFVKDISNAQFRKDLYVHECSHSRPKMGKKDTIWLSTITCVSSSWWLSGNISRQNGAS